MRSRQRTPYKPHSLRIIGLSCLWHSFTYPKNQDVRQILTDPDVHHDL
ncbi:hypothetical protein [Klebsiella phage vB_KpnM_VAC13]|nr:hypothetical protein [Klebsiella phage vB_KpnM_VAC13]WMX18015.1 hypothetical protein [Klebsiella phage KpF2]